LGRDRPAATVPPGRGHRCGPRARAPSPRTDSEGPEDIVADAVVSIEGAEPWSAAGTGERARTGVVVLHGFTGNPNSTRPLGERLAAEGYRVEVPRLPGHGTDVRDLGRTRYADWVAAAEEVVERVAAATDRL